MLEGETSVQQGDLFIQNFMKKCFYYSAEYYSLTSFIIKFPPKITSHKGQIIFLSKHYIMRSVIFKCT